MEEVLVVRNLKKSFKLSYKQRKIEHTQERIKTAVNDISFTVYKGEVFGLLGPNGAGKTTTLRMLSTLITPDFGDAFVEGYSAVKEPEKVRSKIGFMTGELKLENFFTPDYLFNFFSELYGMDEALRERRKRELFSRFGIDRFAQVKLANLSTGMKQKVSLVISVINDPDLIILDEPTNGLDIITARTVTDYLLELKAQGKTIILSTHIFSLAEKICDRVGIITDGRLVALDTVSNLTREKDMEEVFFDIYSRVAGGEL